MSKQTRQYCGPIIVETDSKLHSNKPNNCRLIARSLRNSTTTERLTTVQSRGLRRIEKISIFKLPLKFRTIPSAIIKTNAHFFSRVYVDQK